MGQLKNTVELIGFYGDDLTIACSAWTSTSRNLTEEKKKRVGKMINMLWSEGHEYIIPDDWEGIEVSNWPKDMPMRYWTDVLKDYTEMGNGLYHKCIADLEPVLGRKRAKESARFFKTYNSQIQADIMFNMRSFANFIKLRNSEHAQLEIREIAQQMWDLVESIEGQPFKHTLEAINVRIQSKG
jgi:thymidylate synthase ThyX